MLNDFSLISHSAAAIAYGLLGLAIATRYFRRDIDRSLVLASFVTLIWAGSLITPVSYTHLTLPTICSV